MQARNYHLSTTQEETKGPLMTKTGVMPTNQAHQICSVCF
jgi:hypothetical protein